MSNNEKLWQLEREFWLGDADFYKANLAEDAVMRFPDPVGLLQKEETIKAIATAPRWAEVEMKAGRKMEIHEEVTLLTYEAVARRQSSQERYKAHVISLYRREADHWLLLFHQQNPIES